MCFWRYYTIILDQRILKKLLVYITLSLTWFYCEITQNDGEILVLQMANIMAVVTWNGTPCSKVKHEVIP
jgi:hypothetical protein